MTSSISGTPPSHCCARPRSTPSNFSILCELMRSIDEMTKVKFHELGIDFDAVGVVVLVLPERDS